MNPTDHVTFIAALAGAVVGGTPSLAGSVIATSIQERSKTRDRQREALGRIANLLMDLAWYLDGELMEVNDSRDRDFNFAAEKWENLLKESNLLPKRHEYIATRIGEIKGRDPKKVDELLAHVLREVNPALFRADRTDRHEYIHASKSLAGRKRIKKID